MTQYARGTRAEYRIRKWLEGRGHFVTRSAGSRGPADLIAMNGRECLAIQVKRGRWDKQKATDLLMTIPAAPWLKRQVWTWEPFADAPTVLWNEGEVMYA